METIKASELRLGNYVLSPMNVEFCIKSIDFDRLHSDPSEYYVNHFEVDKVKPIPLTEEWLLKLGFGKVPIRIDYIHYRKEGVQLVWFNQDEKYKYSTTLVRQINIESVHQLQNLYFALTGKELNYNLK